MIVPGALLVYAFLLLVVVAPAFSRARWPDRAPRLAIAGWLALTGTAIASVVLAGLSLAVPAADVTTSLARLIMTCARLLRLQYAHPGGAPLSMAGAFVALIAMSRLGWCMTRTLAQSALARHRHGRGLTLAGRQDHRLGAIVVDHHDPAAWCLPGAGRPVVITTAAISALDYRQLAAVLAHERAHQNGRHHLLVAVAGSIASAFPLLAFLTSHEQITRLVELLADDAAAATSPRLAVAEAILALAAPARATAALSAGGPDTAARVRRLLAAPRTLTRPAVLASALAIAVIAAAPVVIAAGPAVQVIGKPCPTSAKRADARQHSVTRGQVVLARPLPDRAERNA